MTLLDTGWRQGYACVRMTVCVGSVRAAAAAVFSSGQSRVSAVAHAYWTSDRPTTGRATRAAVMTSHGHLPSRVTSPRLPQQLLQLGVQLSLRAALQCLGQRQQLQPLRQQLLPLVQRPLLPQLLPHNRRRRHADLGLAIAGWRCSGIRYLLIRSLQLTVFSRPVESLAYFDIAAIHLASYNFFPIGQRNIAMSVSTCLYVCLHAYLRNYMSKLHRVFCIC